MSKPVKNLIANDYKSRFADLSGAALVSLRGLSAADNNAFRAALASKKIKATVVKNSLARIAFKGTDLEPLAELLTGPNAMVYGGETIVDVARVLVDHVKKIELLEFKGAVMEGAVFGPAELDRLSKFPTRAEAQGKIVSAARGPGSKLAGAAIGPGGRVAGILKALADKLEKGETVQKVA